MTDKPRTINLTLTPATVSGPILRSVQESTEVLRITLDAISKADLSAPLPDLSTRLPLSFMGDKRTPEEKRLSYQSWLLKKGLQELARGVRRSLEEAYFYIAAAERMRTNTFPKTIPEFQSVFGPVRERAVRMHFPPLMDAVKRGLKEPLDFEEQFRALQNVRNCLEHDDGRVTAGKVDPATRTLSLAIPRLKIFWTNSKGEEIEIEGVAMIGETGRKTPISVRLVTDVREFKLGERVVITAQEFADIGTGCWAFSQELVKKLPDATPPATSGSEAAG